MTQDILSNLSSDEVNSISDNAESLQIATIIRQKYFDIINRLDLPDHDELLQLLSSTDASLPVIMFIPDAVSNIKWIKYFNSNTNAAAALDNNTTNEINGVPVNPNDTSILTPPGYQYVTILPNIQFIDMVNAFNPSQDFVLPYTFQDTSNVFNNSFTLYFRNDRQPSYCTVISNHYVLFDSYDSTQDSTLQKSKTMFMGSVIPRFDMVDTFIPDLAEEQFGLLLNEAKALAYYELKQQPHQLAAKEIDRGWSNIQKQKAVVDKPTYFEQTPSFGRRSGYMWNNNGINTYKCP